MPPQNATPGRNDIVLYDTSPRRFERIWAAWDLYEYSTFLHEPPASCRKVENVGCPAEPAEKRAAAWPAVFPCPRSQVPPLCGARIGEEESQNAKAGTDTNL